jgi:hypothetical protein
MRQRHGDKGNTRINKVSAMRPGVARIFEKVYISSNFESPETDREIAANAWCIQYTNTRLSKRVHEHAKSDCFYPSPTYY